MWFRVKIGKGSEIRECVEVAGSFSDGARVFYVEANDRVQAIKLAKDRFHALKKTAQKAAVALGLCRECRCRASEKGKSLCVTCKQKVKERAVERKQRLRSLGLGKNDKIPAEHHKPPAGRTQGEYRRVDPTIPQLNVRTLIMVRNAFLSKNKTDFLAWLDLSIANQGVVSSC